MAYIDFRITNENAFYRLSSLFEHIRSLKIEPQIENLDQDSDLLNYFTEDEFDSFWWPDENEARAFFERYDLMDISERIAYDKKNLWDYATIFSEIGIGEYFIVNCERIDIDKGRLIFEPISAPYGGTEPLEQAIRAFGMVVTYIEY